MKYIGLDGDSIGRHIESLLIKDKVKELEEFSNKINDTLENIGNRVKKKKGRIILLGGDSILFYGDFDIDFANNILAQFRKETGRTASIGIGRTVSETYLGLKLAKAIGGNMAIDYNEEMKK